MRECIDFVITEWSIVTFISSIASNMTPRVKCKKPGLDTGDGNRYMIPLFIGYRLHPSYVINFKDIFPLIRERAVTCVVKRSAGKIMEGGAQGADKYVTFAFGKYQKKISFNLIQYQCIKK